MVGSASPEQSTATQTVLSAEKDHTTKSTSQRPTLNATGQSAEMTSFQPGCRCSRRRPLTDISDVSG
jgi:hypothetical protein